MFLYGNIRSKAISDELSKVIEDLIKIQKKRKDPFTSARHHRKRQKTIATID